MRTTTIAMLVLVILAGPAYAQWQPGAPMSPQLRPDAAASAQTQNAPSTAADGKSYHYWLHPKLGMVKVDNKTHFMLVGRRTQQPTSTASATPSH